GYEQEIRVGGVQLRLLSIGGFHEPIEDDCGPPLLPLGSEPEELDIVRDGIQLVWTRHQDFDPLPQCAAQIRQVGREADRSEHTAPGPVDQSTSYRLSLFVAKFTAEVGNRMQHGTRGELTEV